jgi:hypothetical protein
VSDAAHADVLELGEFEIPYFEPFATDTAFLDTPKGATSVEMRPVLSPTMPYSSASVTRHERARSRV